MQSLPEFEINSEFKNSFTIEKNNDVDKSCCVCFENYNTIIKNEPDQKNDNCEKDLSLIDIIPEIFKDLIIPDKLLVKSCCNIHYICIGCLRRISNDYENHPINESNSHITCPYPFESCKTEIGFENIFDHNCIKKICRTETEWINYQNHSSRYAFPGYTIIKCPLMYYNTEFPNGKVCNCDILIENETIKNKPIGEIILECTQNNYCFRRFCFFLL